MLCDTMFLMLARISVAAVCIGMGATAGAQSVQEIRIRVLNARNGKPITNECVNVSLGTWHGADLIAPTNEEGVVVLYFAKDEVSAASVPRSPCDRVVILGPIPLPKDVDMITITSDEYVDCQEWAKVVSTDTPQGYPQQGTVLPNREDFRIRY